MPSPTAPAGFVVRSQSAAAPPVESRVARAATALRSVTTPTQRSVVAPDREHPLALGDLDARVVEDALCQLAGHAVSGGGAPRMDDSAAAVPAFEAEILVELDPELHEIADPRRRLVREHGHGARAAEATTRAQRVLGVQGWVVVLPDRGGDAALGEQARRGEERSLREDEDVALGRGAEGCEEPSDTAPDDDECEFCARPAIREYGSPVARKPLKRDCFAVADRVGRPTALAVAVRACIRRDAHGSFSL